jgi:hypothetical protein
LWKSGGKPWGARLLPVDEIVEKKDAFHRAFCRFFFPQPLLHNPQKNVES